MVRISNMYNQVTINIRGPPRAFLSCAHKFDLFLYKTLIFPHYEYWGAVVTKELSRRLSTTIVATANARHPLLPIVIQEGVILIKLRE